MNNQEKGIKVRGVGPDVELIEKGGPAGRSEMASFLRRRIGASDPLGGIFSDLNDLEELESEVVLLGEAELSDSGVQHGHKMRLKIIENRIKIRSKLMGYVLSEISNVTIEDEEDSDAALLRKVPKVTLRVINGKSDSEN